MCREARATGSKGAAVDVVGIRWGKAVGRPYQLMVDPGDIPPPATDGNAGGKGTAHVDCVEVVVDDKDRAGMIDTGFVAQEMVGRAIRQRMDDGDMAWRDFSLAE